MSIFFFKKYLCFSTSKHPLPSLPSPPPPPPPPPPPSQHHHHHHQPSSIIIKNFNSLYDPTSNSTTSSSNLSDSDSPPPDFATIFASQRFFFSSPGHSNSIIDSPTTPPQSNTNTPPLTGGIAVPTYSPDPYMDFLRSMQEMVEAREPVDVTSDWKYLHELLLCYLTINPNHTHKYIVGAFSDLLVSLLSDAGRNPDFEDSRRSPRWL